MATPEEIQQNIPDNAPESEQKLAERVAARQKAMQQSNEDVTNHPPETANQEPTHNTKAQPQRRLG